MRLRREVLDETSQIKISIPMGVGRFTLCIRKRAGEAWLLCGLDVLLLKSSALGWAWPRVAREWTPGTVNTACGQGIVQLAT